MSRACQARLRSFESPMAGFRPAGVIAETVRYEDRDVSKTHVTLEKISLKVGPTHGARPLIVATTTSAETSAYSIMSCPR